MATEAEIQARKENSQAKYKAYREKNELYTKGRRFFIESHLPLLVAFPSDKNFAVYITFRPIVKGIEVSYTVRSRRDSDSVAQAKRVLGTRMMQNTLIEVKYTDGKTPNFISPKGQWNFPKLYEVLGLVVAGEIAVWSKCPKWLSRALRNIPRFDFMDQRLVKHIDIDEWPADAIAFAQRQYEKDWPKPKVA